MDASSFFSGIKKTNSIQQSGSMNATKRPTSSSIFTTIPPERVGLYGEYDHSGLAKRVRLAFEQQFESDEIRNLLISQRGAVVILMGEVSSQRLLNKLVLAAMNVNGAVAIEVNGVSIFKPLQSHVSDIDYLQLPSYAY